MAWSDAARAAAAEMRKRRAQLYRKPSATDFYKRTMRMDRQSVAAGMKFARGVNRGKLDPHFTIRVPSFGKPYQLGYFSVLKK